MFDEPFLLDMIFLGTPQLCGGVYISFVYKVSFEKHPNDHHRALGSRSRVQVMHGLDRSIQINLDYSFDQWTREKNGTLVDRQGGTGACLFCCDWYMGLSL